MFATELELGDAAHDPRAVRWALSCFGEVCDVLLTARRDTVVVIHTGVAAPSSGGRSCASRAGVRGTDVPPRWSGEEDRVLRDRYARGVAVRAIAEELHRSPDAVSERRGALGIVAVHGRGRGRRSRTSGCAPPGALGLPAAAVAQCLRRPAAQVRRRRRVLVGGGKAPVPFTDAEDAAITACWASGVEVETLARQLGRAPGSVRLRANKLGLHRPLARPRWRSHEDAVVRDGYERGMSCEHQGATDGPLAAPRARDERASCR